MNILMFTWLFWPHIGGVEKHVAEVGEVLVKRGHSVRLFTVAHDASLPEKERIRGCEVFRFHKKDPERFERPRIWKWLFANRQLIKRADVIHCHDFFTLHYWYLPFRVLYCRKPVFVTFHGFEERFPPERKLVLLRRFYAHTTKGNISVGEYIPKWYGTPTDFITYGGVQANALSSEGTEEGVSAVFVGRVSEDTGIAMYLEAVCGLKTRFDISLPWTVCGDGPLMSTVKRERDKYELDIRCVGFVSDPRPFVQRASIMFSSSYLSMLEAMAMRKLVFAVYQNPLKRDYLCMMPRAEEMMLISRSSDELLEKLQLYLEKPQRFDSHTDRAHAFAADSTWDKVADLYEELYSKS